MKTDNEYRFYWSRLHLVHMVINIALAPALLYLLGLWAWPPQLPHVITFVITTLVALRYAQKRWHEPKLVLNEAGLTAGKFFPSETIYQAQPSMRSVNLLLFSDNQFRRREIHLGWASREDREQIQSLLAERFQRELPPEAQQ